MLLANLFCRVRIFLVPLYQHYRIEFSWAGLIRQIRTHDCSAIGRMQWKDRTTVKGRTMLNVIRLGNFVLLLKWSYSWRGWSRTWVITQRFRSGHVDPFNYDLLNSKGMTKEMIVNWIIWFPDDNSICLMSWNMFQFIGIVSWVGDGYSKDIRGYWNVFSFGNSR